MCGGMECFFVCSSSFKECCFASQAALECTILLSQFPTCLRPGRKGTPQRSFCFFSWATLYSKEIRNWTFFQLGTQPRA